MRPVAYRVDLTIKPGGPEFAGRVQIELELTERTRLLWLNAQGLTVERAAVRDGDRWVRASTTFSGGELVGFHLGAPVGPGRAVLAIHYYGRYTPRGGGLLRGQLGNDAYVYSYFEPANARRAIPCFDEPAYKTPWKLTLHVPEGDAAFANAPAIAETPEPGGMKAVAFAPTRPLPSYLVAIAVGPFDVVEVGAGPPPTRILVPRGRAADAAYAAVIVPEILRWLEAWVGIPHPFEKLDLVAVPATGFAMEHPGLITFAAAMLLTPPDELTPSSKRAVAALVAHELSHLWFGDLVTPRWWSDIWLNEAFATWMADKVQTEWRTPWERELGVVEERVAALRQDARPGAQRSRRPVASREEIDRVFDWVNYTRGGAIIAMVEAWVGPDVFREGVRRYLQARPYGSASTEDFLAGLDGAAQAVFLGFLDQPGAPLVRVALECPAGAPPRLRLRQEPFVVRRGAGDGASWRVPVCVRWGGAAGSGRSCALLEEPTGELPLDGACPEWVLPNAGGTGYYVSWLEGDLGERLRRAAPALTRAERLRVAAEAFALAEAELVTAGEALAAAAIAGGDDPALGVELVKEVAAYGLTVVPDELRPAWGRMVLAVYGPAARAIGWTAAPGESPAVAELRPVLVPFVAIQGRDRGLRAEALRLVGEGLADPKADPRALRPLLAAAAASGDAALFERLLTLPPAGALAGGVADALGRFEDPALAEVARGLILEEAFEGARAAVLLAQLETPASRLDAFRFVRDRLDVLAGLLRDRDLAAVVLASGSVCDRAHRGEVALFVVDLAERRPKLAKAAEGALARMDGCIARRAAAGLDEALAGY